MRFAVLLAVAAFGGSAMAQPEPRVVIEDDVAPATALKCAALRMAQMNSTKRDAASDALVAASLDGWLKSGVDAGKAKQEAAKFAAAAPAAMKSAADDCATFEIKQVSPPGS